MGDTYGSPDWCNQMSERKGRSSGAERYVPLEGNRQTDSWVSPTGSTGNLDKTFTTRSPYGGKVVKKGYTGKKALPLDKSKKKGSPRSYENASRKPLGKGRKQGVG